MPDAAQDRPRIKTSLPGPKAAEIIARDAAVISTSLPREYPLVLDKAEGMWVHDPDGNRFLDFTSGIAVCNTGHRHPEVIAAAKDQLDKLVHTCAADFFQIPMVELAEALARITPGGWPKRIFFGNSGAEAVEAGVKLARRHSGRDKIIAFLGAFHGRTMGALSLTASKPNQKKGFGPFVPGVRHVPYGHCYRCAYRQTYPDCNLACVDFIEEVLFESVLPPEEVAAIVVEPIQGEGGYIVPPPEFHPRLKTLAERYGILYIADEIQAGMGRTGRMMAMEHFGVAPDMSLLAKGIASGFPLSALVSRADVMDWEPGSHGSTYGGNPVSCAAAVANIRVIEDGLIDNARDRGHQLRAGLDSLARRHEVMGDVRGLGLMQAVELVKDRHTKDRAVELRNKLLEGCFEKGLLLLSCGRSTIRFCPPLLVTPGQVDTALEIFDEVLTELTS